MLSNRSEWPMARRIAIEGLMVLGTWLVGSVLWIGAALRHDEWTDRYWSILVFPPADAALNPHVQLVPMLGPLIPWVCFRSGR
jgi:hypothetical protein